MDASHFDADTAYAAINTLPPRRPAAAHLSDARRRQDLDGDHRRASRRRDPSTPCARTRAARTAVRRHRAGRVRLVRRRRPAGSRCASTCRRRRSAISSSRTTTWSSGTHGRSFWILDDITPLRQTPIREMRRSRCVAVPPAEAWRFRWNTNTTRRSRRRNRRGRIRRTAPSSTTTLKSDAADRVSLEILDGAGQLVRRYSSDDPDEPPRGGTQHPRLTGSARRSRCRRRPACIASCGTCTTRRRRPPSSPTRTTERSTETWSRSRKDLG